jgi:hypothetical protein
MAKIYTGDTASMGAELARRIRALGVEPGETFERWEHDGVWVIGPATFDPDTHWYLYYNGDDCEGYETGVDIVHIGRDRDAHVVLESIDDLEAELRKLGWLA